MIKIYKDFPLKQKYLIFSLLKHLNDIKKVKYEIKATINCNKKITSVYSVDFEEANIVLPDNIIVKKIGNSPFTWICRKEDLIDMSVITFIWGNNSTKYKNGKYIHNQYFNGYMFGYSEEDIKQAYLTVYSDVDEQKLLKIFERNKNNLMNTIEYCKQLDEYKEWIKIYFPEINNI
jgi:hypothetical protein